jgi:hypothetical protein
MSSISGMLLTKRDEIEGVIDYLIEHLIEQGIRALHTTVAARPHFVDGSYSHNLSQSMFKFRIRGFETQVESNEFSSGISAFSALDPEAEGANLYRPLVSHIKLSTTPTECGFETTVVVYYSQKDMLNIVAADGSGEGKLAPSASLRKRTRHQQGQSIVGRFKGLIGQQHGGKDAAPQARRGLAYRCCRFVFIVVVIIVVLATVVGTIRRFRARFLATAQS